MISDYETVFQLLEEVKGPLEVHRYFIHHTIKEAARYATLHTILIRGRGTLIHRFEGVSRY